MKTQLTHSLIELLEPRIAPAAIFVNATTATYKDVDGDMVTVKFTKPILTSGNVTGVLVTTGAGLGDQLQTIDLTAAGIAVSPAGTNVTVSVKLAPATGDGLANVGAINATGIDLGIVTVKGDLGMIDAGNATTTTPGLKSLAVQSLGRFGTTTGAPDLESDITGALSVLIVRSDIVGAFINVTGGADGKIGALTVGSSLLGGATLRAGAIYATGNIGPVKIGGNIEGGDGEATGQIRSTTGKIVSLTLGGSLLGGGGTDSGQITSFRDMGAVKIGGDIRATDADATGSIFSAGIASVTLGGSLIGGANFDTGKIIAFGNMGAVKIGGSIIGASASGSNAFDSSGYIQGDRIASLYVGGSIITGVDNSSGDLTNNGSVRTEFDIGSVTIKGSLIGHTSASGDTPVIISARGQEQHGVTSNVAIGKISIGGRVDHALILAGYEENLIALNGDAQIGAVTVAGDWIASSLVAGATNPTSGNRFFGNGGDALISGGSAAIQAKIASITIGGQVLGTIGGTDQFGFVAEQIGLLKVAGTLIPLKPAAHVDNRAIGPVGDMALHEI